MTIAIVTSSVILKPHPLNSPALSIVRTVIIFFATVLLTKYTVYMFLCPWFSLMASREDDLVSHFVRDYHPLVSVMIPAWNEECGLLGTVKSLLASTYKNMELVVVNDGSTDRSDAMMRNFIEKYEREMTGIPGHVKIIYHYQQNGGKGSALNAAIKLAHGDILVPIDADCIVHKRAVATFVKAFRDPRVMAAVGNVRIGNTKTLVGTVQELEYTLGFFFKKADSLMNTIYIIGGAAGAFRKEVFTHIGGYNTTNITEDIELSVRIQERGWKVVYCPDALVYTEGASTLQGLMKQRLRWKRGRIQTFWQYRHLFFSLRPEHNKILTCCVLPLAAFGDVQLSFEPLFILILYVFSFFSGDFTAFISGVIIVSMMFFVQAWEGRYTGGKVYLFFAPIAWLLFYITTITEFYALTKSLYLLMTRRELKWQKWQRSGVSN
jgi:poly-beta-1,6-N-acetyl-D-glucosamine synthase